MQPTTYRAWLFGLNNYYNAYLIFFYMDLNVLSLYEYNHRSPSDILMLPRIHRSPPHPHYPRAYDL